MKIAGIEWTLDPTSPVGVLCLLVGAWTCLGYGMDILALLQSAAFGGMPLKNFGAKKGAWAIVTGATAGIGYEFSLQFANAGFNVLLVARDPVKLASVKSDIEKESKDVQVKTHQLDFGAATKADFQALRQVVDSLDTVGVLINNVGKSHAHPEFLANMPEEECDQILKLNVQGLVDMTRIVVPKMTKQQNGWIANIGSFSGTVPSPLLSVYSGSKSFMHSFSQALGSELEDQGIVVTLINTYFVTTALSKIRKPSWLIPTPKAYVKSVLSHIGTPVGAIRDMPYTSTPHFSHGLAHYVITTVGSWPMWFWYNKRFADATWFSMPKRELTADLLSLFRMHLDIRKRALKKKERQAKEQ